MDVKVLNKKRRTNKDIKKTKMKKRYFLKKKKKEGENQKSKAD